MNSTLDPLSLFGDDAFHGDENSGVNAEPDLVEQPVSADQSLAHGAGDEPVRAESSPQPEPEPPGPAQADASVAASSASIGVGSTSDMDAWLSQSPAEHPSGWAPTDAAADAAMAAWLAADPNAPVVVAGPVIVVGGRVERPRPKREPLVPRWLPWVLFGLLVFGALTAGGVALLAARARVLVPTVAGLQSQAAKERLSTVGLTLTISDRRFSTLPVDTILSQTPEAGAQVRRGTAVTAVVSAGTEEFTMPDIVGEGLTLARSQLLQKGLEVQVEKQSSDQPSDTVLATNPAAGSPMHTGDIVKLSVATGSATSAPASSTLVPYTMTGVRVMLDPAPPVSGQPDASLEVAQRLQSLLEASGAKVTMTRSAVDTGATGSATVRQQRAREGSPIVSVGFDLVAAGAPGLAITYPSSQVATAAAAPSQLLTSQIASALAAAAIPVRQVAGGSDVVMSVTNAPYSRVTLGSTSAQADLANLRDPNWADKVARAAYTGLAAIYGVRNPGAP